MKIEKMKLDYIKGFRFQSPLVVFVVDPSQCSEWPLIKLRFYNDYNVIFGGVLLFI